VCREIRETISRCGGPSGKSCRATYGCEHDFFGRKEEACYRNDDDVQRCIGRLNNVRVPNEPSDQEDVDDNLKSDLKDPGSGKAMSENIRSGEAGNAEENWKGPGPQLLAGHGPDPKRNGQQQYGYCKSPKYQPPEPTAQVGGLLCGRSGQ